jgi:hypothetical protein
MYPQLNRSNSTTVAHQVQISDDVGATIHIEPKDNPRAGEPSQAWFALTRKGGRVIPLTQCECELLIYAEPHTPGEPALLEPSLEPVSAERYQGIPGAEITFPRPGLYQLQLNGKPKTEGSFQPFKFNFQVTVAAGTFSESKTVQNINYPENPDVNIKSGLTIAVVALTVLVSWLVVFFILREIKRRES